MRAKLINEAIKHLSPKSSAEIADLEKRGFVMQGGKWKFKIDISKLMGQYVDDEDTEEFRKGMAKLLRSKLDDIIAYLGEDEAIEYENLAEEFEMLDEDPEPEQVDYVMNMMYDWADDNNVWIESFDF